MLSDRAALDEQFREAKEKIGRDPQFVSQEWKVFAVAARSVEFWQGATDRMHQRLRYERAEDGEGWVQQMLYP